MRQIKSLVNGFNESGPTGWMRMTFDAGEELEYKLPSNQKLFELQGGSALAEAHAALTRLKNAGDALVIGSERTSYDKDDVFVKVKLGNDSLTFTILFPAAQKLTAFKRAVAEQASQELRAAIAQYLEEFNF